MKQWSSEINLQEKYGAHSLGKARGYFHRVEFGVPIENITQRYLLASPAAGMGYPGRRPRKVVEILVNNAV